MFLRLLGRILLTLHFEQRFFRLARLFLQPLFLAARLFANALLFGK